MHIKSIVAAAAITLIANVGSVSADELSVADTAVNTGTPFAMLDGIATEQMSDQELAETHGAYYVVLPPTTFSLKVDYDGSGVFDPLWPTNDVVGLR